jgi:hypothetical protein
LVLIELSPSGKILFIVRQSLPAAIDGASHMLFIERRPMVFLPQRKFNAPDQVLQNPSNRPAAAPEQRVLAGFCQRTAGATAAGASG